jgi:hypothetical protein
MRPEPNAEAKKKDDDICGLRLMRAGRAPGGKSVKPAVVRGKEGLDPSRTDQPFHTQEIAMKTRSILSLAALAMLSVAALAPTKASAWGGHGGGHGGGHYGGGHYGGGHYGGHYGGGYGRGYGGYHNWGHYGSGYGYRPYYRPNYETSYPTYAPSYPVSEHCDYCEAPAPVYHATEPCNCEAPPQVVVKRVYVPVRVEVPVPVRVEAPCECEAPVRYVPPPVEENCNCETPSYRTRETYAPRQQPYQDRQANYASKELEKN